MRALVLDFDGVISDSGPEVFLNALRTYAALRPASRLARREECRRALPDVDLDALLRDPLYVAFSQLMPLGNRAEDFGVALDALDAGVVLRDQDAYDAHYAALRSREPAFPTDYHGRFYDLRAASRAEDEAAWARLSRPYPAFVALLERRHDEVALAIATAKDRASVRVLLRSYGLDALFPDERLLDKTTGVSKRAHLERIAERLALPFAELTFVDDKVNHLDGVRDLGVRCGLAAWGYNGEREVALARQRGDLVLTLEDAERQLFEM